MTIQEKIASGYYSKTTTDWPSETEMRIKIMQGMDEFVGTKSQIEAEETRRKKEFKSRVNAQREQRRKELSNLEEEFKRDLLTDFGVLKNKRADKCFDLAMQYSRSDGFQQVYYTFEELVELIK